MHKIFLKSGLIRGACDMEKNQKLFLTNQTLCSYNEGNK